MALYSHNGKYPSSLQHRITLSNGKTRTGVDTFTPEEIADAGYIEVDDAPAYEYPNKLDWDSAGMQWIIRQPDAYETEQRWAFIRNECERRLFETDYKIIKAMEAGVSPDPVYVKYRQELRDLYNNVNDVDPWFVEWPSVVAETANTEPSV
jgi:hypothetical protein